VPRPSAFPAEGGNFPTRRVRRVAPDNRGPRPLPLRQPFERREKLRVGNRRRLGSANYRVSLCAQRRYRKRHGNAVVAKGVERCAVKLLPAGNSEPVVSSPTSAPIFLKLAATAAMRSDSLTRNSRASRISAPSAV